MLCTLAIFNLSYGLLLALVTTAMPDRVGAFFRAVWLLPRMSPSVVYALLWTWVVAPTDYGLLNQILGGLGLPPHRPEERCADAGDRPRQRLHRRLVRDDHLHQRHPLDPAAPLPCRPGRRRGRARHRPPRHPAAIRWQLSFVTLYQALSLLVSFEYIWLITDGGPFYDTTVYALYVYKRAFDNGQYAYGAALALGLVIVGIAVAMLLWRFFDMRALLQKPRIEVS